MRKNGRSDENHDDAAGNTGQKTPNKEPRRGHRKRAGEKRQRDQNLHGAQRGDVAQACGERSAEHGANQIANEIRSAEIDHRRCGEPVFLNEHRQQGRVGKARQTDADQARTQPREDRRPNFRLFTSHSRALYVRQVELH